MIKKKLFLLLLAFMLPLSILANDFVIKIDPKENNKERIDQAAQHIMETVYSRPDVHRFVFESSEALKQKSKIIETSEEDLERYPQLRQQAVAASAIYKKAYPNGDFYFLIGNLEDQWSKDDYTRFYTVAKWLSKHGFRTILNVTAFIPDLQEAISNPQTTAMVWNSHGASDGGFSDANGERVPTDLFTAHINKNLRYILFGNCWGLNAETKYNLKKLPKLTVVGWDRTVDSNDLFGYLISERFDEDLAKALNIELKSKGESRIK